MLIRIGLVACWIAAAAVGLVLLMGYDTTPGLAAAAPVTWPADSHISRDPARPTLVMLAHPRCDCTKASIGELAEIIDRKSTRLNSSHLGISYDVCCLKK